MYRHTSNPSMHGMPRPGSQVGRVGGPAPQPSRRCHQGEAYPSRSRYCAPGCRCSGRLDERIRLPSGGLYQASPGRADRHAQEASMPNCLPHPRGARSRAYGRTSRERKSGSRPDVTRPEAWQDRELPARRTARALTVGSLHEPPPREGSAVARAHLHSPARDARCRYVLICRRLSTEVPMAG